MTGRIRIRFAAALIFAALAVGAGALPAAAATTVKWVNDNNTGTWACRQANFSSIQDAIDASSPRGVVNVCPGTYEEQFVVDVPGLTVQSSSFRKAHLMPPPVLESPALVTIVANGARLRGFHIDIPAGNAFEPLAAGAPAACEELEAAVVVLASGVTVSGNYIDSIGDATLSGECGYWMGILFVGDLTTALSSSSDPIPLGPGASAARRNYIRDFKLGGIVVEGADMNVRIKRNDIRYVHFDDPATCVPVNTLIGNSLAASDIQAQAQYPCEPVNAEHVSVLNGLFLESVGIGIFTNGKVDIGFNTVHSTLDIDLFLGPESSVPLAAGIWLAAAGDGSRVTENVVTQSFMGILLGDFFLAGLAAEDTLAPDGVEVSFNRTNEGYFGMLIEGTDHVIYANRARLNLGGIGTFSGEDNLFDNNDARYNFEIDCFDETEGDHQPANTANTWQDSFGNNNDPEEICQPLGIF